MKLLLIADGALAAGGSSVLMTHNERLADRLDEFTRAIAAISKKRNKTEADEEEIGRLEFYGGLYTAPQIVSPADLNGQAIVHAGLEHPALPAGRGDPSEARQGRAAWRVPAGRAAALGLRRPAGCGRALEGRPLAPQDRRCAAVTAPSARGRSSRVGIRAADRGRPERVRRSHP